MSPWWPSSLEWYTSIYMYIYIYIYMHVWPHPLYTVHVHVITPCACARGKVIGSVVVVIIVIVVVVSTKIAKSQKVGTWQSALCHQTVESHEKLSSNCLERPMNTANCAFSPTTPIDHTYQCHDIVLFPLCMLDLKKGKGHRVIKSVSTPIPTRHYTALQLTQWTRLGISHCY